MKLVHGAFFFASLALSLAVCACKGKDTASTETGQTVASASAKPSVDSKPSIEPEQVAKEVNPKREAPYSGPAGTVRGVVHVTGDSAPTRDDVLAEIPDRCDLARRMYTRTFREGPGRTLADVIVGVTGYKGYVPALSDKVVVNARGCAFEVHTIAMTFGQHLEVLNRDGETYIPQLIGASTHFEAYIVAMPGGDPVKLFPRAVGQFGLVDKTHDYALAHIFVLRYATVDVTDTDGKSEIGRVPAGDVVVSAYSPNIGQTVQQKVTVPPGGSVEVNFEIPFDAKALKAADTKKDAGTHK